MHKRTCWGFRSRFEHSSPEEWWWKSNPSTIFKQTTLPGNVLGTLISKVIWRRDTFTFLSHSSTLFLINRTTTLTAYSPIFHPYFSDMGFGYHFPSYNIGSLSHSPFLQLSQVCSLWVQLSPRVPEDISHSLGLASGAEIQQEGTHKKVGGTAKAEEHVNKYIYIASTEDDSAKKSETRQSERLGNQA